jgi:hypothetical protein
MTSASPIRKKVFSILQGIGAAIILGSWILEKTYVENANTDLDRLEADLARINSLDVDVTTLTAVYMAADQSRHATIRPLIDGLAKEMNSIEFKYADPADFYAGVARGIAEVTGSLVTLVSTASL